jgi:hypothetical protein
MMFIDHTPALLSRMLLSALLVLLGGSEGAFSVDETVTARGLASCDGTAYALDYGVAIERAHPFTGKPEIVLVMADVPVSASDADDDWIEHADAHLTMTLDPTGRATYARLDYGSSLVGTPDQIRFDGRIDRAAQRVIGTVSTDGELDVQGTSLSFEVELDAPLFEIAARKQAPKAELAAIEASPQLAAYRGLQQAVSSEDHEAIEKAITARYFEWLVFTRLLEQFMPVKAVQGSRLVESDDTARLYLETTDQTGIVRLTKDPGGWRIDAQIWRRR